ncbi:hypothetical protein M3J09_005203 [Ascochyta lentis]
MLTALSSHSQTLGLTPRGDLEATRVQLPFPSSRCSPPRHARASTTASTNSTRNRKSASGLTAINGCVENGEAITTPHYIQGHEAGHASANLARFMTRNQRP